MAKGACMAKGVMHGKGGVHGKEGGMHGEGGMCDRRGEACVVCTPPPSMRYGRSMRGAVRILLECILVLENFAESHVGSPRSAPLFIPIFPDIDYIYRFWFFAEKPADDVSFDDIIDDIGGFGLWQLVIFILISIFDILAAFAVLLPVFAGKIVILRAIVMSNSGLPRHKESGSPFFQTENTGNLPKNI